MGYDNLHSAVANGDIDSVETLIAAGKDINELRVSEFILVYLLTTTHSVSLLFYYSLVILHLCMLPIKVTKK